MFVSVKFFYGLIEHRTQGVGCISAALGKSDGCLVTLCMGRIGCHMLCIVGVIFGDCGVFLLGMGDAVVKE